MNKMILSAVVVLVSQVASAKSLQGDYVAKTECEVFASTYSVKIPAGQIEVIENVKVGGGMANSDFPAIILQSNGNANAVLTLGIGKVQPFRFGVQPFTLGEYAAGAKEFTETFVTPGAPNEDVVDAVITLTRSEDALTLASKNASSSNTCFLERVR